MSKQTASDTVKDWDNLLDGSTPTNIGTRLVAKRRVQCDANKGFRALFSSKILVYFLLIFNVIHEPTRARDY